MKNPCAKLRDIKNPYAIFRSTDGWEWRVLKKNQPPEKEGNPYATWFCAVKTPFTFGSYEYGDVYIADILRGGGVDVTLEEKVAEKIGGLK